MLQVLFDIYLVLGLDFTFLVATYLLELLFRRLFLRIMMKGSSDLGSAEIKGWFYDSTHSRCAFSICKALNLAEIEVDLSVVLGYWMFGVYCRLWVFN